MTNDSYYSHLHFIDGQCTGCGRLLVDIQQKRRWLKSGEVSPVCERVENLVLISSRRKKES